MKKKLGSLLIALMMVMTMIPSLAFAGETTPESIPITEEYFPDEAFRECLISEEKEWYVGNGDGILSSTEIKSIEVLYLWDKGIVSLEGLEYLTSIKWLHCQGNFITVLPELPDSLEALTCSDNYLTELPELPNKLHSLVCYNNKLIELPELPSGLTELNCERNSLTLLPQLPESLTTLDCSDNKLSSLQELPSGLETLSCGNNLLTTLPTIPDSVKELSCSDNKELASITNLPANLQTFYCEGASNLTSIPKLPEKLQILYLTESKIGGVLDISELHYLKVADLWGNVLIGLKVSDKAHYENVDVNYNYMSSKSAVTGRDDIDWDNIFYFGTQKTYCQVNGHTLVQKIGRKASVYQGSSYAGSIYGKCTKCNYENWTDEKDEEIPAVKSIKLSATSYTYNGKAKKPTVTVYDTNGKKIGSSNYTVSYASGRKNVGKYKVTVKFKGSYYTGSRYVTFKINPKGTSISKLTKAKKGFTVKWKKQSGKMAKSRITGYQYRYSTSSKMTSPKTVTIKGYSKTSAKKTGLKAKKKYYVQVRTYMTVSGTKYYSSWSKAKAVTTK